jgi:epoxyqueuosine reductase
MYLRYAMPTEQESKDHLRASNARFIEKAIQDFVKESPANRLPSFDNEPIFDEPLVGFADGDDPLFQQYKKIIDEFHFTPREAYEAHLRQKGISAGSIALLSVISFILPISKATRLSLRRESEVPSLRWNHTRFQGQDFINELSRHIVSLIEGRGFHAVAPEIEKSFAFKNIEKGLISNWSQRHVAYAAGLGTFSLNDGFITPRGMAMRCGSVVTDMELPVSSRPYKSYRDNCLFYRCGSCGRCIQRCPAGALSENGHDKNKCREYVFNTTKLKLKQSGHFEGFIGPYAACGLCQTRVPCESMIPPDIRKK